MEGQPKNQGSNQNRAFKLADEAVKCFDEIAKKFITQNEKLNKKTVTEDGKTIKESVAITAPAKFLNDSPEDIRQDRELSRHLTMRAFRLFTIATVATLVIAALGYENIKSLVYILASIGTLVGLFYLRPPGSGITKSNVVSVKKSNYQVQDNDDSDVSNSQQGALFDIEDFQKRRKKNG